MAVSKLLRSPRKEDVRASIDACLANAERLMDDALQLEFQECGGARLAICMLAQEEFAKAFLLYMVREELVPWDTDLLRVTKNHECKHLVALLMEYIDPEWETLDELRAILDAEYGLEGRFPPRVSSALNILYHHKIRRCDYRGYSEYDQDVVAIAFGKRDKAKQDSIFVDLDKSCRVKNAPTGITKEQALVEYERARRYASIVARLVSSDTCEGWQLEKLKEAMKIVFWQKYKPMGQNAE